MYSILPLMYYTVNTFNLRGCWIYSARICSMVHDRLSGAGVQRAVSSPFLSIVHKFGGSRRDSLVLRVQVVTFGENRVRSSDDCIRQVPRRPARVPCTPFHQARAAQC